MAKKRIPMTTAVRALRTAGIAFTPHPYKYVDRGGTRVFAEQAGVDENAVIKTLVMEDDAKRPFVVLMHGDREISTKELAKVRGVRFVRPCVPETAERHSGYKIGGTSPFGLRKQLPVYVEETILDLPRVYINGGKRGFLIGMDPMDLPRILTTFAVRVAAS